MSAAFTGGRNIKSLLAHAACSASASPAPEAESAHRSCTGEGGCGQTAAAGHPLAGAFWIVVWAAAEVRTVGRVASRKSCASARGSCSGWREGASQRPRDDGAEWAVKVGTEGEEEEEEAKK